MCLSLFLSAAHLQRLQNALKRLFYPSQGVHLICYTGIQYELACRRLSIHTKGIQLLDWSTTLYIVFYYRKWLCLVVNTRLHNTRTPTHTVELKIRQAKAKIENVPLGGGPDEEENKFWETLIKDKLKPETVRFTPIDDLKANLKSLRNSVLAILLLVNIMWIILLYTLEFSQLIDYGFESRAFQTLFLAVYGIIIVIQFVTLLCHRSVTLVHYLGRTQPDEIVGHENREALVVTLARDYTVWEHYLLACYSLAVVGAHVASRSSVVKCSLLGPNWVPH